jgi:hypothetical protein
MEFSIPVELLKTTTPALAVTPESIRRVVVQAVQRRLYAVEDLEDLLADDEPEEQGRRPRRRAIGKPDLSPRYEIRFDKEIRWSQGGLMLAQQPEGLFLISCEGKLDRVAKKLQDEQPNAEWRLVAAKLRQTNLRSVSYQGGVGDPSPNPLMALMAIGQGRYDSPPAVRAIQAGSYSSQPDVRWHLDTAWADVKRSELVDPNLGLAGDGLAGPMSHYAASRQYKHMPRGLQVGRDRAIALIREFYATQRVADDAVAQAAAPRWTQAQVEAIRTFRSSGTPPAQIAALLNATQEEVEQALA